MLRVSLISYLIFKDRCSIRTLQSPPPCLIVVFLAARGGLFRTSPQNLAAMAWVSRYLGTFIEHCRGTLVDETTCIACGYRPFHGRSRHLPIIFPPFSWLPPVFKLRITAGIAARRYLEQPIALHQQGLKGCEAIFVLRSTQDLLQLVGEVFGSNQWKLIPIRRIVFDTNYSSFLQVDFDSVSTRPVLAIPTQCDVLHRVEHTTRRLL